MNNKFLDGFKKSTPIIMGYFPVSFTYGIMASNGGLDPLIALTIALTNFTSAGQFIGTNVIISNGTFLEVGIATFVVNIRYALMSLSLSQRIVKMPLYKKMIMSFGITDEIFAVAALEKEKVSFSYMMGLTLMPYLSWAIGTITGAYFSTLLPEKLQNAMGIALYGMFLALVVPEARKSKKVLSVVVVSIAISIAFRYISFLKVISGGWVIIIATIIASTFGAIILPQEDGNE
ncbi:branched-chain amino acid permease protein/azaleucin resistance protein AzlC [Gottschalkia acidurici 9a]|uniref:Branched-chain amino acid permease protein/azaleucin resistance protein AzlC n=1 Tax=Gottschalkia acidurici (strain ATCC 7906 / DSM 604 / BCRC 14475 / CIP 104303 / KCTC 5404 / NCIMB 10678 / 9a) TaxID=1128398 RepID=K0AY94_GOTA9|nr:AzlC family ABC transporter permease [Gottschalkia acidurici]AFS77730.1 branched-chain amino acid permease protein/azaleucin resistance protein AzlC [Gottschalkia acidurici 9a]